MSDVAVRGTILFILILLGTSGCAHCRRGPGPGLGLGRGNGLNFNPNGFGLGRNNLDPFNTVNPQDPFGNIITNPNGTLPFTSPFGNNGINPAITPRTGMPGNDAGVYTPNRDHGRETAAPQPLELGDTSAAPILHSVREVADQFHGENGH